jgi:hypothetical protein
MVMGGLGDVMVMERANPRRGSHARCSLIEPGRFRLGMEAGSGSAAGVMLALGSNGRGPLSLWGASEDEWESPKSLLLVLGRCLGHTLGEVYNDNDVRMH